MGGVPACSANCDGWVAVRHRHGIRSITLATSTQLGGVTLSQIMYRGSSHIPGPLSEQEDLMRRRTPFKLTAVGFVAALLVSACGGDGGDAGEDGDTGGTGGTLRIYSSEPASLLPGNASDQPAILVIRQLYSGLVDYDAEGAPQLDLAESIETEDNQTWTIKIKDGYTFHNGEPVNADSFIRAWNYTADGDNAWENAYFMNRIVGFDESQDGADELCGLAKVDDLTFTVELDA